MSEIIRPIAFFRSGDRVAFWLDTPRGWALFDEAASMPRALLAASIGVEDLSTGMDPDFLLLPFASTSLPLGTPNEKLAGCGPKMARECADAGVPVWDGPTSRTEEEALMFSE